MCTCWEFKASFDMIRDQGDEKVNDICSLIPIRSVNWFFYTITAILMSQEEEITLGSLSISIYKDLISSISHEIIVESLIKEQITRLQFGKLTKSVPPQPIIESNLLSATNGNGNGNSISRTPSQNNSRISSPNTELLTRTEFINVIGRDIFGNEKVPDSARYFICTNCSRKISGNRFAAHIDRCLGGRQRK